MTQKKAVLSGAFILVGAAAILGLILVTRDAGKRFYRLEPSEMLGDERHFEVDHGQQRLFFKNNGEKELLEEVPTIQGSHFYLKGKKQVKISPKLFGRIGFYTYLYLQGRPKNRSIEFNLEVHRGGKIRRVRRIHAAKTSYPLFQELDVRRGDQIVMKFSGRGIGYYSQPILYEKFAAGQEARRANVILVAVDTFRGDQLGAVAPGLRSLTPNLDRFAGDAVRFENVFAQTSWTLPSFMSLFTGLNEYNHGVGIKAPLPAGVASLVGALSGKFITFGYHGGMVMKGKWGFSRGFDFYKEFKQATPLYPQGGRSLFEKAVELLQQSQFPRLFLFLHTYQLHSPYTPPREFLRRLNPSPLHARLDAINYIQPAKTYLPVADEMKQSLKELYQAEILAFDHYFGEFVFKLKEMGLYDTALIIVMSDHGEEFFDHGGWAHAHGLYNELIKVPLVIKFPGGRFRGTRPSDPVGIVDIMPTILGFQGLAYDAAGLDGTDLMPLIRGRGIRRGHPLVSTISTGKYFEHYPGRIALIDGRYKLIYNEPYTPQGLEVFGEFAPPRQPAQFELYDLLSDPRETSNIFLRRPRGIEKMLLLLSRLRKQIARKQAGKKDAALDEETTRQLRALGYL
jgi:choline-sulfatase